MIKKIFLATTVFAVMVLFCEFTLRQIGYSARLPSGRLPRYYLKPDPVLGHEIQENFKPAWHYVDDVDFKIWGNELGCYDKPYAEEDSPILLVGDSFAHQYGPYEHKWGTVLEEQLNHRILKCGVMATGTKHQLLKAKKVLAQINKKPSVIIVSYLISNDVEDDFMFPRYDVYDGFLVGRGETFNASMIQQTKWWLHEHSIIYKTVRDNLKNYYKNSKKTAEEKANETRPFENEKDFYGIKSSESFETIWARHLDNMRGFEELAKSQDAKLLVVLIPDEQLAYDYLYTSPQQESIKKYLNERFEAYKDFLKSESIPYVDLLPNFKEYAYLNKVDKIASKDKLYWSGDNHFSIKGEMLAGLTVAKYMAENLIPDGVNKEDVLRAVEGKWNDNFPGPK